jgi:hypothetical protein
MDRDLYEKQQAPSGQLTSIRFNILTYSKYFLMISAILVVYMLVLKEKIYIYIYIYIYIGEDLGLR